MCCSQLSLYRQLPHVLKLPRNIITENMGFTILGFLPAYYAEVEYSVIMCVENFLIGEFK